MKYFISTFGCKVNTSQSEYMKVLLERHGHTYTDAPETADIIIVNSCAVTQQSSRKSVAALRKIKKSINRRAVMILAGCYPQAFSDEAYEITQADIVIGTKDIDSLPQLINEFVSRNEPLHKVVPYGKNDPFEGAGCDMHPSSTRTFLKIQDGCNSFCSYCIIPYARGRCRSMHPESLMKQAENIVRAGFSEIVLCGINLASYGKEYELDIADAVQICADAGVKRVRLGSLEPEMITENILAKLAKISQFCPQFHLSLQSGSDCILKRMNRRYTSAEFELVCTVARKYFPLCAITTDVITGFPGETAKEFKQTMEFARKIGFAKINAFAFSERSGTPAAEMEGKVDPQSKKDRADRIRKLSESLQLKHHKSLENHVIPVLFELEKGDGFHIGHAPDGTVIKIPEKNIKKSLRKSIFYVRIEKSDAACCYGDIVEVGAANPL